MPAENKYTFRIIGTDETKRTFAAIGANIRKTVNLAGTLGTGVAAGLAVMVTKSIEANTEMVRLGHAVGVGAKAMSEWAHAAGTVEVGGDKVADIFKDMSEKIGEFAATGGGEAADVFKSLNLDVRDFIGLSPDQQLLKVGQALDQVDNRGQKVFFLESLASDASKLLPLLEDNAAGFREMQAEAEKLGTSISEVDASKLEMANRSMERVQALTKGFATQVAVEVSPIIEVLAEKFVGAATEGDRMGTVIKKGFEIGAKVVGIFADGIHGVHVLFKGLEVLARGLNFVLVGGFVKLIEIIGDVGNAIVSGIVAPIRKILELAAPFSDLAKESLEGIDALVDKIRVEVPAGMQAFADAQASAFDVARGELHALLMEDLPSKVIKENIDKILAEAEARALEKTAEIKARLAQGTETQLAPITITATRRENDPGVEKAFQDEQQRIADQLARMDEIHMTELERIQARQDAEIEIVERARRYLLIGEEEYERRKQAIQESSEKARMGIVLGGLSRIVAVTGHHSKTIFRVQKALALAQAAISLPAAVIETFKNAGGWPWGIVPAAAMAAEGAAQIAAIKNQQMGGGEYVPAIGGGGEAAGGPAAQVANTNVGSQFNDRQSQRPQTVVNFHIAGDVVGDTAETILGKMKTLIEDTDAVLFGPNSRQAQELVVT